jgi:hypothetical protein
LLEFTLEVLALVPDLVDAGVKLDRVVFLVGQLGWPGHVQVAHAAGAVLQKLGVWGYDDVRVAGGLPDGED